MINKNKFVKIINTLKDYSKRQENLNKAQHEFIKATREVWNERKIFK